jgi:hypothetical protein
VHLKAGTALLACAALVALAASVSPAMAVDRAAGGSPAAGRANGLTWKLVPSPNGPGSNLNSLSDVSCPSPGACVAVGESYPAGLAESWNGTAWKVVSPPAPPPGSSFQGVTCVSARLCTAVGELSGAATLVETWNGTAWKVVPSPNGGPPSATSNLSSVSCVSARDCTAVGSFQRRRGGRVPQYFKTLVESWNGTSWAIVPSPNGPGKHPFDELNSVSCVSAQACVAVGSIGINALVESWNGTAWTIVPSPAVPPSDSRMLFGVSCLSASACTAVGETSAPGVENTLVESWNGTAWKVVPSPNGGPPASFNGLAGVSCVSVRACTAVGAFFSRRKPTRTLVESWDGTAWTIVPSPNKVGGGAMGSGLSGVSCPSAAMCMAVGSSEGFPGVTLTELGTSAG